MQQSSFGFPVTITTDLPLSGVTDLWLLIAAPSGAVIERQVAAGDINSGAQTVTWHVQSGDLAETGAYRVQLLDNTSGKRVASTVTFMNVQPNVVASLPTG